MKLTDLQWNIDKILMETPLSRDDRSKAMMRIRAEIEKFGMDFVKDIGQALGESNDASSMGG